MTQRDSLLAGIFAAPEDDAPRLVFSDWLEDHGEMARAEFIRLQIRLEALGQADPERPSLMCRERELLTENRDAWLAEIPTWPGVEVYPTFRRGWPDSLQCTAAAFLKQAEKIIRHLPLRELSFEKMSPAQCVKVAAMPLLARVRTLILASRKIGNKGATAFFQSPHLAGLTSLNLYSTGITADSMKSLASSAHLKQLQALELSGNTIYDSGIADLANAEGWDSLRKFQGYGMGLSEEVAACFADAPIFSRLTTLELAGNWLGDPGVVRLLQSGVATWNVLDLSQNTISDAGAAALARSPRTARLECLRLAENSIGTRGVVALAASPYLTHLRELDLSGEQTFGNEGALAIANSPYLKNLVDLDLDGADFGPEGMEALARSSNLAGITRLNVGTSSIGPRGARAIATSPHLRHLETLFLWSCQIGDEGCLALMQSPNLANLTWLSLDNNGLTDVGAQAILDCPHFRNLSDEFGLDDDGISDDMVRWLRQRFKDVLYFARPSVPDEDE